MTNPEEDQAAVAALIRSSPDTYNGYWVATTDDVNHDPVLVVGTTGDPLDAEHAIREVFSSNLCVVLVEYSADELNATLAALGPKLSMEPQLDAATDRVAIWSVVVDSALYAAIEPFLDTVDLRPAAVKAQ